MNYTHEEVNELENKCKDIICGLEEICQKLCYSSEANRIWARMKDAIDVVKQGRDELYLLRPVQ